MQNDPEKEKQDRASDIRIGISSCLLGEQVRYDGGHRRNDDIVNVLGRYFTFVPVCPEVEVGMGVPRETLHLVGDPDAPRHRRDDPAILAWARTKQSQGM